METRFVTCQSCDGYGAHVSAGYPSRWPDGSENNVETPCPECEGTGRAETRVYPVERDDDLTETDTPEQKEAA